MDLKDTYIFCEFLHNCVQVTSEFGSKHQSYFAEIFTSNRTFISNARSCQWVQFALDLGHKLIQHPLHRIQKNAQLKKMVPWWKKKIIYFRWFFFQTTEKISYTSSGIKNVSTAWLANFWKYLESIMGTELSFNGDKTSQYFLSKDSKIAFSISAVAFKRKGIPLQILDEFLVRQGNKVPFWTPTCSRLFAYSGQQQIMTSYWFRVSFNLSYISSTNGNVERSGLAPYGCIWRWTLSECHQFHDNKQKISSCYLVHTLFCLHKSIKARRLLWIQSVIHEWNSSLASTPPLTGLK